jgi:ribosomal-protein-alanine N-acetyltransferase
MIDRIIAPYIRDMTKTDLKAVLEIDHLSFPIPWSENTYKFELRENRASHLYVAEIDEGGHYRVVGYVGFWFIVDEAHISTLAVHPDFRGQGIGELLLNTVLDNSSRMGARIVTLEVRTSNSRAINLYRKHDFKVVGSRPRYYRDNNEDALLMTLEILEDE